MAYDPVGIENFKKLYPTEIEYVDNLGEALKDADMAFLFTEWKEIKGIELSVYETLMKTPIIFDGRNCYEIKDVEKSSVEYHSVGRKVIDNLQDVKVEAAATLI